MGKFFPNTPEPPPPPPPPPAPPIQPSATKGAGSKAAAGARKRRGQASTIITGAEGLMTEAPTIKPSLLGQNKVTN